jgi:hypothetical protein
MRRGLDKREGFDLQAVLAVLNDPGMAITMRNQEKVRPLMWIILFEVEQGVFWRYFEFQGKSALN